MGKEMIDGDKGNAPRPGEGFPKMEADQQGTGESGLEGCGDSLDVLGGESGFLERFQGDAVNPFGVSTACYFGNNALPMAVNGDLGCDNV
jgi:hypothetical protein